MNNTYCWGDNMYGQIGDNTSFIDRLAPVSVYHATGSLFDGKTATTISAGSNHACAVADNNGYCWGSNSYGQLGNNTDYDIRPDSNVPVQVFRAVANSRNIRY